MNFNPFVQENFKMAKKVGKAKKKRPANKHHKKRLAAKKSLTGRKKKR
jgi:hypothetical protein